MHPFIYPPPSPHLKKKPLAPFVCIGREEGVILLLKSGNLQIAQFPGCRGQIKPSNDRHRAPAPFVLIITIGSDKKKLFQSKFPVRPEEKRKKLYLGFILFLSNFCFRKKRNLHFLKETGEADIPVKRNFFLWLPIYFPFVHEFLILQQP